jgi:hypothetical protein
VVLDGFDHSAYPANGQFGNDYPASDCVDHPVNDHFGHAANKRHAYCPFHEEAEVLAAGFAAEVHVVFEVVARVVDDFAIVVAALNRNFLGPLSDAGPLVVILL